MDFTIEPGPTRRGVCDFEPFFIQLAGSRQGCDYEIRVNGRGSWIWRDWVFLGCPPLGSGLGRQNSTALFDTVEANFPWASMVVLYERQLTKLRVAFFQDIQDLTEQCAFLALQQSWLGSNESDLPRAVFGGMPPEAASVLYEATRITLMSLDIVSLNAKTIIEPMNLGVAWGETLMEASGLEICQGRRRALEDKAVEGALSALMMTDEPHEVLHDLDQIANQNLPEILLRKRGILEHLNSYRATHRMPPFVQSYEEALRQVSQRHLAWTAVEQAGYLLRLVRAHLEGLNTIQKCDETHGASFIMDSMVAFMVTMTLGQARSWALQLDLSQRNQ